MEGAFPLRGNGMYKEIERLLIASKEGDIQSKEALLLKLKPLILNSIKRYYNRIDLYDDLIQEGYEIILKGVENYDFKRKTRFLGYIKLLLKYNYLDKHKEEPVGSLNIEVGEKRTEIIDLIEEDQNSDPMIKSIDKETSQQLSKALNLLGKRQKEIVVYFYIHRLSMLEISHMLDISYRTVINTKTIAIKKLRKTMVR